MSEINYLKDSDIEAVIFAGNKTKQVDYHKVLEEQQVQPFEVDETPVSIREIYKVGLKLDELPGKIFTKIYYNFDFGSVYYLGTEQNEFIKLTH